MISPGIIIYDDLSDPENPAYLGEHQNEDPTGPRLMNIYPARINKFPIQR